MNSKFVSSKFVIVFAIGLLFVPGCTNPTALMTGIKVTTAVIALLTTTAISIKRVEAATLEVEEKKLKIEGIKKNGEKVTVIQKLSDSQLQQIKESRQVEIKLEDGSKVTVTVTAGSSQLATSSELEKIKSRAENSRVTFKNKDIEVSGKITESWIQQTSKSEDSGAASRIEWNDGFVSTILFLENSKVRIWVRGIEYSGKWSWTQSGTLQVQTDQGSYYSFSS